MATVTHTFPGTIVYTNPPSVTATSILAIDASNQVGTTSVPIPPTLANGQIYVGTSNPSVAASVTPTTNGGVSGINSNTINLISNGNTTTFNVKVDETSTPQLRGLIYDIPIDTPIGQPIPQVNQWAQVFNYTVPATPGAAFPIYSLITTPNSVYMVEFNFCRIINGTANSTTKQVFRISDNAGIVNGVSVSTISNGIGVGTLSTSANRVVSLTTGINLVTFTVLRLTSASRITGTVTVIRAV